MRFTRRAATPARQASKRMDVDLFLRWLAVNSTIGNWDAYGAMAHNYYLYGDPHRAGAAGFLGQQFRVRNGSRISRWRRSLRRTSSWRSAARRCGVSSSSAARMPMPPPVRLGHGHPAAPGRRAVAADSARPCRRGLCGALPRTPRASARGPCRSWSDRETRARAARLDRAARRAVGASVQPTPPSHLQRRSKAPSTRPAACLSDREPARSGAGRACGAHRSMSLHLAANRGSEPETPRALAALREVGTELLAARALLTRVDRATCCHEKRSTHCSSACVTTMACCAPGPASPRGIPRATSIPSDLRMYDDHRRGRCPRYKVRMRHHLDRTLSFLEVKRKAPISRRRRPS